MSTRKRTLSFSISALIAFAMGCGGGGSTVNVRNPTAPPASTPISIAFKSAPGGSLIPNATAPLTAVVTNDQSNAGVDWVLTCSNSGNCGSISPLHTQSGGSTTYTAPASVSGTGQAIIVEAFATADHTKNVAGTLNIMGFTGSIKGNYVFETQGVDANGSAFQLAGVVALDGNGNVTGGEQTHGDFVQTFSDTITGGSYTLGPDGRGTLTINTADQNIGQAGIENFGIVFLSNAKLLLVTLDSPNLQPSNETSSGIMDLQTSTAAPAGGYAFVVNGVDISLNPLAMGGVMNIGSSNTIEKTGSVIDQDDGGTLIKKANVSGTSTNPDSFGSLKFTLTSKPISPNPLVFTGYIVDSAHIKLIESDNSTGTGFGATTGIAVSQGTATGTFTNSSFSGNFVFGILGQDLSFAYASTSLSCAGSLTANGSGKFTSGLIDEYLAGFGTAISDSFTGTYKVDTTQTGRANARINFTTNGPGPEFIFYLTGNGNPPLVLDADSNIGSVGTGAAYPQASAPIPFNGPYGLYFTQNEFALENDASAEIAVNGSAQTLSGTVDTNFQLSALPNTAITGTFNAIPSTGRVPGTLTNTFFQAGGSTPNTVSTAYYLIDSGHAFVVETDSATTGILLFGYLSQRTPLCQGCP